MILESCWYECDECKLHCRLLPNICLQSWMNCHRRIRAASSMRADDVGLSRRDSARYCWSDFSLSHFHFRRTFTEAAAAARANFHSLITMLPYCRLIKAISSKPCVFTLSWLGAWLCHVMSACLSYNTAYQRWHRAQRPRRWFSIWFSTADWCCCPKWEENE